jgi:hypothetical protein
MLQTRKAIIVAKDKQGDPEIYPEKICVGWFQYVKTLTDCSAMRWVGKGISLP